MQHDGNVMHSYQLRHSQCEIMPLRRADKNIAIWSHGNLTLELATNHKCLVSLRPTPTYTICIFAKSGQTATIPVLHYIYLIIFRIDLNRELKGQVLHC